MIVVRRECRSWARQHQGLLRQAFTDPSATVDLTAGLTWEALTALGGERLDGVRRTWTCAEGDDALDRRILGLDAPPLERGSTVPELYERHPGLYVIVRHRTDRTDTPVFKGAYRG